jgi:DNA invertase Pin-like site-specific DNA recombinase
LLKVKAVWLPPHDTPTHKPIHHQLSRLTLKDAGCEKIFTEKLSGAKANRPALQQALDYLRPGDTLVVWKLSRLARNITQAINTVKELEERQLALKIITQNIDTSTPEGRLFFHMNAAFDQFQREIIVENTKEGLKAARKRGRIGGRKKTLTEDQIRTATALLKDSENYPFISDIIKTLKIGRTTFYRYFTPEQIRELRTKL